MTHLIVGGRTLKLDDVEAEVASQLETQSDLGVQITRYNDVPETGPVNKGVWYQIPDVTVVFADLKRSTELSAVTRANTAAYAYTYFIRAMTVILGRFGAKYIDIQGDGIFGLFSGQNSTFFSAACAITMKTQVQREVAPRFARDTSTDWKLTAGIGIDHGTLLVRRLGLRRTKQNEVWAGKPVNMAAKLSSVAGPDQMAVADRVFRQYEAASRLRRRALIWSCGCDGYVQGDGLDVPSGETPNLWVKKLTPVDLGLDFEHHYKLSSEWCVIHGSEFCETIVTGRRPSR